MSKAQQIITLLENKNDKGFTIGTKGKTGTHEKGGIYRGSAIIPRSQGGVMVLVGGDLYSPYGDDELRFKTEKEAKKFLDSLRKKTKAEKNDIPF